MAGKRGSKLSNVVIPIETCLSIVAAAIEVYPKECMGCLIVKRRPSKKSRIATVIGIFPYQLAKRSRDAVESGSHWKFKDLMRKTGSWDLMGDFHSHPYTEREKDTPTEPSWWDLENISVGDTEVIIKIVKVSKKSKNFTLRHKKDGTVDLKIGYYECNILAFSKIRGKVKVGRKMQAKHRNIKIKVIR